jgi:hypothetical protein
VAAATRKTSKPKADYTALADDHLNCREFRHSWAQVGPYRVEWHVMEGRKNKERILARTAACIRCGTRRIDKYRETWDKRGSNYAYVDGYELKGMDRGNVTHEVHSEFFKRSVAEHGIVEEKSNA